SPPPHLVMLLPSPTPGELPRHSENRRSGMTRNRKPRQTLSSKRAQTLFRHGHFGWIDWSPPGLPGGGITGIVPPGGVGCLISGSTWSGGQITPPDLASLSLRFPCAPCWASTPSPPFPTVVCVSEWAHAFGSSCSALGATGAWVCGGYWATPKAGRRTTEAIRPKTRIAGTIELPLFRLCP